MLLGVILLKCMLDKLTIAELSQAAQVDHLFHACRQAPCLPDVDLYHPSLLRECADPYVRAEDMLKFWRAVYKKAPSELKEEMDRIDLFKDALILEKEIQSFLEPQ